MRIEIDHVGFIIMATVMTVLTKKYEQEQNELLISHVIQLAWYVHPGGRA